MAASQSSSTSSRAYSDQAVERALLKLVEQRHPKTVCPSEVARALAPDDWRGSMERVRAAAVRLSKRARVDVLQHGSKVDPAKARGPIRFRLARSRDVYHGIDFRQQPERYRIGRGEQGVFRYEPYKSELLPSWRFKTEVEAKHSSKALYAAFVAFRARGDFVGMDMARKFVQMGYTRARRYANHGSGRKYDARGRVAPPRPDHEKARAAAVFERTLAKILADPAYERARAAWPRVSANRARPKVP